MLHHSRDLPVVCLRKPSDCTVMDEAGKKKKKKKTDSNIICIAQCSAPIPTSHTYMSYSGVCYVRCYTVVLAVLRIESAFLPVRQTFLRMLTRESPQYFPTWFIFSRVGAMEKESRRYKFRQHTRDYLLQHLFPLASLRLLQVVR